VIASGNELGDAILDMANDIRRERKLFVPPRMLRAWAFVAARILDTPWVPSEQPTRRTGRS
jgi:hypothetical protein